MASRTESDDKRQHDHDIREELHRLLDSVPGHIRYDEVGMGESRADCVLVDTRPGLKGITGYEIKSATDNLLRLPSQIRDYSSRFRFNWLVAAPVHIRPALDIIPAQWGVMEADGVGDHVTLTTLRNASPSVSRDAEAMAEMLWRDEALDALRALHAERGVLSKPRTAAWSRLATLLTPERMDEVVVDAMLARTTWRP